MAGSILPFALGAGLLLLFSSRSAKVKTPPTGGGQPFPPGTTGEPCTFDADLPLPQRQITESMLANPYLPASTLVAAAMIAEANGFQQTGACLRADAARRGGDQNPPPGFDPNNPATWGSVAGLPSFPGSIPGGPPPGAPPGGPPPPPGGPPPPPPGGPPPPPPGGPPPPPPGLTLPPGVDPFNPATWVNIPIPTSIPPWLVPGQPPPGIPPIEPPPMGTMLFTVRYEDRPYGLAKYYTDTGARFKELEPGNPQLGPMVTTGGISNYANWQAGLVITLPASWNPLSKPVPPTGL